jgi:glutamate 5-kinase
LHAVAAGEEVGTLLSADQKPLAARKQWLAGHLQVKGQLVLDAGAVKVLTEQGRSLLAVGVSRVVGTFTRGELVSCVGSDGTEIARGLVNYNSDEAERIKGQSTESISEILGYREDDELIHRDNLVVSA